MRAVENDIDDWKLQSSRVYQHPCAYLRPKYITSTNQLNENELLSRLRDRRRNSDPAAEDENKRILNFDFIHSLPRTRFSIEDSSQNKLLG